MGYRRVKKLVYDVPLACVSVELKLRTAGSPFRVDDGQIGCSRVVPHKSAFRNFNRLPPNQPTTAKWRALTVALSFVRLKARGQRAPAIIAERKTPCRSGGIG